MSFGNDNIAMHCCS